MLDGYLKSSIDPIWEAAARPLAAAGFTPNQVTLTGLALIVLNCAAYLSHQSSLWFGIGLAFCFAFDALDGAVARLQGSASKYGGYLDAVIDRYQEIVVFGAIALVNDWWMLAFLCITGSLLTSYNKARTAVEMPISNETWPDLFERLERIVFLCAALVLDSLVTLPPQMGTRALYLALGIFAAITHITAVQRFLRARYMLLSAAGD